MWGYFVVNVDLPKYMNDVMHVSVEKNGLYSSLPKFLSIFVSIFTGFVSDWMYEKCKISLTIIRKVFVSLGTTYFTILIENLFNMDCCDLLPNFIRARKRNNRKIQKYFFKAPEVQLQEKKFKQYNVNI